MQAGDNQSAGENLLNDALLERSSVVANSCMNRDRRARGTNSYEKELGLDPLAFLNERLRTAGHASWLDLCCGRGRALIDAARQLSSQRSTGNVDLCGVDLVDRFDDVPSPAALRLEATSLHRWNAQAKYDLITCVHGLHYIGDKLGLIERAAGWLTRDGLFLAHLDLANLRTAAGSPLARSIGKRLRAGGLEYNGRRHLLRCCGAKTLQLGYQYKGADDTAGPNFSGQEAVASYYAPVGESGA